MYNDPAIEKKVENLKKKNKTLSNKIERQAQRIQELEEKGSSLELQQRQLGEFSCKKYRSLCDRYVKTKKENTALSKALKKNRSDILEYGKMRILLRAKPYLKNKMENLMEKILSDNEKALKQSDNRD